MNDMQLSTLSWQMSKCGPSVAAHRRKLGKINPFCYIPIWWEVLWFLRPPTTLWHIQNFNSVGSPGNTHHTSCTWFQTLLGAFAKLRKMATLSRLSIRLHGKTRLPLDGFSRNFNMRVFQKSAEKIQDELKSDKNDGYILYAKPYVLLWYYLTEFFWEWDTFKTNAVQSITTHYCYSKTN